MTYAVEYDIEASLAENFKNEVDRIASKNALSSFLQNAELFKRLLRTLRNSEILHLLSKIKSSEEVESLCSNLCLVQHMLEEFLLNDKLVQNFNSFIQKSQTHIDKNIHTIFSALSYQISIASQHQLLHSEKQKLIELLELNEQLYLFNTLVFTLDEKIDLYRMFKDNEQALKKLRKLLLNNLENTFNFESLKNYLSQP